MDPTGSSESRSFLWTQPVVHSTHDQEQVEGGTEHRHTGTVRGERETRGEGKSGFSSST